MNKHNTPYHVVGVDVGAKGGVTTLTMDARGRVTNANLIAMPFVARTKSMNLEDLLLWCAENTFTAAPYKTYVFIELAQAYAKQGVVSMFNFGRQFGMMEALAKSLKVIAEGSGVGLEYYIVPPKHWQTPILTNIPKGTDKKDKKKFHEVKAVELYPSLSDKFKGPKGGLRDGIVDSLLIAEFGRRVLNGELEYQLTDVPDSKFTDVEYVRRPLAILDVINRELVAADKLQKKMGRKSYKRGKDQKWLAVQRMEIGKIRAKLRRMEEDWARRDQCNMKELDNES